MYPHIEPIQVFVDGMIEAVNKRPQRREDCGLKDSLATWLRDFKTIGYKAPRQCGATFWLHTDFLKYNDAILVVPNQSVREQVRNAFDILRKHIPIGEPNESSLPRSVVQRIVTQYELVDYIHSNHIGFQMPLSRIYIQNTKAFFKAIRRDKFYNWLADVSQFDGFIICNDVV